MNQKLSSRAVSRCLCLGALLCSAALAHAGDIVITFQVDMTEMVGNGFTPGTDFVDVHGTFNNWGSGSAHLTNNPAAANPNIYSGTLTNTHDADGGAMEYKYVINDTTYESAADSDNRAVNLPAASGASLVLPLVYFNDDGPTAEGDVTFQVDMSEQVNLGTFDPANGDVVVVTGSFNGWPTSGVQLSPGTDNTNIWSVTVPIDASTNASEEFKYIIQPGTDWEGLPNSSSNVDADTGNRFLLNYTHTLPVVFFNEVPYSAFTVTNNVTFEVDMSVQEAVGGFTNGLNTVEIHGDFNGWGNGVTMTNNPNASDTNIYSTVIQYIGAPGANYSYKYVIQPGTVWENVPLTGGNRTFTAPRTSGNIVVGPDWFSFQDPSTLPDFLTVPTEVTFTVNMTNATEYGSGTAFDPSVNTVWLNGLNNGNNNSFWTWGYDNGPAQYQMNQVGDSLLYTLTVLVNHGQPLDVTYKYGIDALDNEAGSGDNHTRYIRSLGSYTMPVDVFGSQGAAASSEPSFGDLAITKSGGSVSVSWLGRPGVHLQSTTSLAATNTTWTPDLNTDGTNLIVAPGGMATTNMSIGAGNKFFELVRP